MWKKSDGKLNSKRGALQTSSENELTTLQLFRALDTELKELIKLKDGSIFRRILDHEDEQNRIAAIFERINDARIQFEVRIRFFGLSV